LIRIAFRVAWMVGLLLLCVPVHYLWRLFGVPSPWPRRFLRWVGRAAGMRLRVLGEPLAGNVLFLANHLSWLDILLLADASGTAFVSKAEVAEWPLIGWMARLNNTVFVARDNRRGVKGQVDALREALRTGQPVALFPEGTTDGGAEVLPFRGSLLASLYPALPGVKVQPVALDYGPAGRDLAWVGDEKALANVKRVLARRGTTRVSATFLAPLDPEAIGDRKRLAQCSRDEIVDALGAASGPPADRL
jgi:1-acyl-sn-glycerol-3-phosphate acyltransferase